jgi:membrane protease YdiL (CAAX protease family)
MPNIRYRDILAIVIFCYTCRTLASLYVFNNVLYRFYLLNLLLFNVALVVLSIKALDLNKRSLRQIIGPLPEPHHLLWATLLGVAIAFLEPGLRGLLTYLSANFAPDQVTAFWTFWGNGPSNAFFNFNRAIFFLIAVVAGPIAEEFVFRGLMLAPRIASPNFWRIAVVSSALFALLHFNKPEWISTFASSICLAYLYRSSRSLIACVVAHMVSNALALVGDFFIPHLFDRSLVHARDIGTWWLELSMVATSLLLTGAWIYLQRVKAGSCGAQQRHINMQT